MTAYFFLDETGVFEVPYATRFVGGLLVVAEDSAWAAARPTAPLGTIEDAAAGRVDFPVPLHAFDFRGWPLALWRRASLLPEPAYLGGAARATRRWNNALKPRATALVNSDLGLRDEGWNLLLQCREALYRDLSDCCSRGLEVTVVGGRPTDGLRGRDAWLSALTNAFSIALPRIPRGHGVTVFVEDPSNGVTARHIEDVARGLGLAFESPPQLLRKGAHPGLAVADVLLHWLAWPRISTRPRRVAFDATRPLPEILKTAKAARFAALVEEP